MDISAPNANPTVPNPDNHFYPSTVQQTLIEWFKRDNSSLGELYEGALRLLHENQLPGYTRFVSHAVREIRNRLPEVLAGFKGGKHLEYKDRVESLKNLWDAIPIMKYDVSRTGRDTSLPRDNQDLVSVPLKIIRELDALIRDHSLVSETRQEAAKRLFEAANSVGIDQASPLDPTIDKWLDVTEWFMELAHDSGKVDADIDLAELMKMFAQFEGIINSLVGHFYSTTDTIDEILQEANA